MGWTSFLDNAGLSVDTILRKEFTTTGENGVILSVVDSATRANAWYAIVECKRPNDAPVYEGLVCLYKRSKRTGEFSYKDMGERCGPNASNAPKRIIDKLNILAPIGPNEENMGAKWAKEWRAKCLANASAKKNRVKPTEGLVVCFSPNGPEYQLVENAGARRGWYVTLVGGSGMLYRATCKDIANSIIV